MVELYNILKINGINVGNFMGVEDLILKKNTIQNSTISSLNSVKVYGGLIDSCQFQNINNINLFNSSMITNNTFEDVFNMVIVGPHTIQNNSYYHVNNVSLILNSFSSATFNEFTNANMTINNGQLIQISHGLELNGNLKSISHFTISDMGMLNLNLGDVEHNEFYNINNIDVIGICNKWTNADNSTSYYITGTDINWQMFETNDATLLSLMKNGLYFNNCNNVRLNIKSFGGILCFSNCSNVFLTIDTPWYMDQGTKKYLSYVAYNIKIFGCVINNTDLNLTHTFVKSIN